MHAERGCFRDVVLPELQERLRRRFCHLDAIDLRLGIDTVSLSEPQDKELLVLKVCLREIKRSQPFLIAIIGDRYGWVPPLDRLRAAANESGLVADVVDKSVTALEIEYGALIQPMLCGRCRFYLREPLPYEAMGPHASEYSDAHASDPDAPRRWRLLDALKLRIRDQVPEARVSRYRATWDLERRQVVGLEKWAQQVIDDLWTDLQAAVPEPIAPLSAYSEEDRLLSEFIGTQCREFIGRENTINELLTFAIRSEGPLWAKSVTGEPGAGKSSLFGELCTQLNSRDVLVLPHAAGIGGRSSRIDVLLRRWTAMLCERLLQEDPTRDDTPLETLVSTFADCFSRAAVNERVVCVIDALDAFDPVAAARHMTWLPELWPQNARLITTAISGCEAAKALERQPGVEPCSLDPLRPNEAIAIARAVCGFRTLHPDVLTSLLEKRRTDGTLASSNPLWLELALDHVLLLDADDFLSARDLSGTAEQQLHALLVRIASELPSTIAELYAWLLRHAEKVNPPELTQAFAWLMLAAKNGWREMDLRALLSSLIGRECTNLELAVLRRSFRRHVVQRGSAGQWDFAHAQLRIAIARGEKRPIDEIRALHARVVNYLLTLAPGDSVRRTELMRQLIRSDDESQAMTHYSSELPAADAVAASRALAEYTMAGAEEVPNPGTVFIDGMLTSRVGWSDYQRACDRLLFQLCEMLESAVPTAIRAALVEVVHGHILQVDAVHSADSVDWALSQSYFKMGALQWDLGHPTRALDSYDEALLLLQRLYTAAPDRWEVGLNVAAIRKRVAYASLHHGDLDRAARNAHEAERILTDLHARLPANGQIAQGLAAAYDETAGVALAKGRAADARGRYEKSLKVREALTVATPDDVALAQQLAASHHNLAEPCLTLRVGDPRVALEHVRRALAICERIGRHIPDDLSCFEHECRYRQSAATLLARMGEFDRSDDEILKARRAYERLLQFVPDSASFQNAYCVLLEKAGNVAVERGALDEAKDLHAQALAARERLLARAPLSAAYARQVAVSCSKLADVYSRLGSFATARNLYERDLGISKELRERSPDNAEYARDLVVTLHKLFRFHYLSGDLTTAQRYFALGRAEIDRMRAARVYVDPGMVRAFGGTIN